MTMLWDSKYVSVIRTLLFLMMTCCIMCDKNSLGDVHNQSNIKTSVEKQIASLRDEVVNSSSVLDYNDTVISRKKESSLIEEGRKKKQNSLLSRLLPLLVMPFMISTMMLPMMLAQMKFMLLKAIFLGKLAIIFATLNILRNMGDTSGLYSHNVHLSPPVGHVMKDPDLSKSHYGYTGDEEYGAYVNKKK